MCAAAGRLADILIGGEPRNSEELSHKDVNGHDAIRFAASRSPRKIQGLVALCSKHINIVFVAMNSFWQANF